MGLEQTIRKIENLEIQGATDVAIEGVKALRKEYRKDVSEEELEKAAEKLKNSRPTEPALFNALEYVLTSKDFKGALKHFDRSQKSISKNGLVKFRDAEAIYTHCHSDTVVGIIEKVAGKKDLKVHNTETRPLYQGRTTAKKMSNKNIDITHYIDSAARFALEKSDYMLIGADAVNRKGDVYNKIGSRLIAESAEEMNVPVFVCTDSWKYFDGEEIEIEMRDGKEVWEDKPEEVSIRNPAFEKIPSRLIDGLVTEIGVVSPISFESNVRDAYPDIFE